MHWTKKTFFRNFGPQRSTVTLTYISKLTERAAVTQLCDHMRLNALYPSTQSSYRQYHSTETALLKVKNYILMNMNKQHVTLFVLLNLSAAFDAVDHFIPLQCVRSSFSICGIALTWFRSYLCNRSQRIIIDGESSKKFELDCWVPQGSCLGHYCSSYIRK